MLDDPALLAALRTGDRRYIDRARTEYSGTEPYEVHCFHLGQQDKIQQRTQAMDELIALSAGELELV